MRTFHIGGTASRAIQISDTKTRRGGTVKYEGLRTTVDPTGKTVALSNTGSIHVCDVKGRTLDEYDVTIGAHLLIEDGGKVKKGARLLMWDPLFLPLLAMEDGVVQYVDVEEGKTMLIEVDEKTGVKRTKIIESRGDLHPQLMLLDKKNGSVLHITSLPEQAYIEIKDGAKVKGGQMMAKSPRTGGGTQDITGGLPRVTELFEARVPKAPAIMSEIEGIVILGEKRRAKRAITVKNEETGIEVEHMVPQSKHLRVHEGDFVKAGDPLVDGQLPPNDILKIQGEEHVQAYMVDQIQSVYRAQGVGIDDKHVEIIVAQMMRKVVVTEAGDSELLPNSLIDRKKFHAIRDAIAVDPEKALPGCRPEIMGITKASVQSESFISAASFQETTKVLTEAALRGKTDTLLGLKENVILGNLIPAGTGFRDLLRTHVERKHDFRQFDDEPDMSASFDAAMAAEGAGLSEATEAIAEESN